MTTLANSLPQDAGVTGIGQGISAITSPSMSKWIELGVQYQSSLGTTICEPSESITSLELGKVLVP